MLWKGCRVEQPVVCTDIEESTCFWIHKVLTIQDYFAVLSYVLSTRESIHHPTRYKGYASELKL